MKKILKSILPVTALNTIRRVSGQRNLNAVRNLEFYPGALRYDRDIDLATLLTPDQGATDALWQKDQVMLAQIFGDMHRWGGVNPGDRRALYYLLSRLKPAHVLEVGTHIGASTLYIAQALKSSGTKSRVTTVDILDVNAATGPWSDLRLPLSPMGFAKAAGVDGIIDFRIGDSVTVLNENRSCFDFIFLDGDHTPRTVYCEMSAALRALKPGGVILLHDYYPQALPLYADGNVIYGPFSALERITKENPSICVRPLGQLPWPTKQNSSVTSLALVTRHD